MTKILEESKQDLLTINGVLHALRSVIDRARITKSVELAIAAKIKAFKENSAWTDSAVKASEKFNNKIVYIYEPTPDSEETLEDVLDCIKMSDIRVRRSLISDIEAIRASMVNIGKSPIYFKHHLC